MRVHRNRKPAEDILAAGAKEVKTNAELARASDIVILCVTGSPQIEEIVYGARRHPERRARRPDRRRHLDRRALVDGEDSRRPGAEGNAVRRRAAGAHAQGSRGRPAQHDGRRRRRDVRAVEAGAVRVLRERHSRRRRPGTATCSSWSTISSRMAIATATAEACAACAKSGRVDQEAARDHLGRRGQLRHLPDDGRQDARKRRSFRAQVHAGQRDEGPALLHALRRVAARRRRSSARPCTRAWSTPTCSGFGDKYVASLIEAQEKLAGVKIVAR